MYPSYLELFKKGELAQRADEAFQRLEFCSLCPRRCGVNRLKGQKGYCKTGEKAVVYSYMPHHGEEPPISGSRGSGTIFFSNCNMSCVYCQNFKFSQQGEGREVTTKELAGIMLELQADGCHNINLVTPTHSVPQILKALLAAVPQGLHIPLVYNTSGYELAATIYALDGIVDIFLADMRYADSVYARVYSDAADYPEFNRAAVQTMHELVGVAAFDTDGIAVKGLIIRHLVLPNAISGTGEIMRFIAEQISPETYISLMSQYTPYHKASAFSEISRRITKTEYEHAQALMERWGLSNGWIQEQDSFDSLSGVHIKPRLPKDAA